MRVQTLSAQQLADSSGGGRTQLMGDIRCNVCGYTTTDPAAIGQLCPQQCGRLDTASNWGMTSGRK